MAMRKLTGYEAIEWAEAHDALLRKYADPIEDARDDLTVAEARDIASEDQSLIYVEIPNDAIHESRVAPRDLLGKEKAELAAVTAELEKANAKLDKTETELAQLRKILSTIGTFRSI